MALKESLRAIGGGGSVAIVVDALVGTGKFAMVLADFFLGNIEMFIALVATLSGRLAPQLAWLPEGALNKVVLALAAIYVFVIVGRLANAWTDET